MANPLESLVELTGFEPATYALRKLKGLFYQFSLILTK